jgi:hypothetical protein
VAAVGKEMNYFFNPCKVLVGTEPCNERQINKRNMQEFNMCVSSVHGRRSGKEEISKRWL